LQIVHLILGVWGDYMAPLARQMFHYTWQQMKAADADLKGIHT
jgi:hypothetical protein